MIYEIVRKLPEGAQIVLEASGDGAVLTIRAGRSRFTLQTLPESDFPDLAAGEMTHTFKVPAADLKRLIDKTQFAISTEETRYYLNGIYLHPAGPTTAQTLRAFTDADLKTFYASAFRPENGTLLVVGDVTAAAVVPLLEQAFGSWKAPAASGAHVKLPMPPARSRREVYLVDKPNAPQSQIRIGAVGVARGAALGLRGRGWQQPTRAALPHHRLRLRLRLRR